MRLFISALACFLSLSVFSQTKSTCENLQIEVGGGEWDNEISWTILDNDGDIIVQGVAGVYFVCLDLAACYTFNMFDSYGDGWDGATAQINQGNQVIYDFTLEEGGFGIGGIGAYDDCGECNGDGIIADGACDCDGNVADECGVCGGDNSTCTDCAGVVNGMAVEDCTGVCGGTSEVDECGVCGGGGIAEGACDCDGNILDECGVCGGGNSSCSGCTSSNATNYDSTATIDDGSCMYDQDGYNSGIASVDITSDNQEVYDGAYAAGVASVVCPDGGSSCPSDLDNDGAVATTDLLIFLSSYGGTCTIAAVPGPVITVTPGTDTVEQGATWTDAGATADGGETVTVSCTVDTSTLGTYTITYTATDAAGNTGTATRIVTVVDTTAPVITVTSGTDTVEGGSTWTDAGATADGGETVTVSGTVDTSTVGTYTITYTATDASENVGTATRTVTVVDTTAPVITVTPGTDTVEQGATWTDAGATADGGETVTVSYSYLTTTTVSNLELITEGTYPYSLGGGTHLYSDQSVSLPTFSTGDVVNNVTVRMIVRNNDPVVLICNGISVSKDMSGYSLQQDQPFTYFYDVEFSFQGLGLTGEIDGFLLSDHSGISTANLVTSNNLFDTQFSYSHVTATAVSTVDTNTTGTYTITYTATDASGNTGTATRTVTLVDTTAPVITVTPGTDTVGQGDTWTDAGATADTGETVTASGTVDTSTIGSYTITYTATDAAGNTGTATRTVTVVDTTAPVITVTSGTDTVEGGSTWTDAGATSDTGETVTSSGAVDTNTLGTYTITYTATDAAGNTGTATRTVTVVITETVNDSAPYGGAEGANWEVDNGHDQHVENEWHAGTGQILSFTSSQTGALTQLKFDKSAGSTSSNIYSLRGVQMKVTNENTGATATVTIDQQDHGAGDFLGGAPYLTGSNSVGMSFYPYVSSDWPETPNAPFLIFEFNLTVNAGDVILMEPISHGQQFKTTYNQNGATWIPEYTSGDNRFGKYYMWVWHPNYFLRPAVYQLGVNVTYSPQ